MHFLSYTNSKKVSKFYSFLCGGTVLSPLPMKLDHCAMEVSKIKILGRHLVSLDKGQSIAYSPIPLSKKRSIPNSRRLPF